MNSCPVSSCKAATPIRKKVSNSLTLTSATPATYNRFIYDGWNLLLELDGNNTNAIVRSYIWGSDLSGTMQGAGGVGGLLMINDPTTVATHFVAYDGNGDVAATVSGSARTTTATYEYGPFGELIRSSGTISKTNPYRFSTKYQDNETDLLYYGYRYYTSSGGRWLNRDPIGEKGGINLYVFVRNASLSFVDRFGLQCWGYGGGCGVPPPGGDLNFGIPKKEQPTCKTTLFFEFLAPTTGKNGDVALLEPNYPSWVDNFGQIISKINATAKPYDPDGNCCKWSCISKVTISHHGSGPGTLPITDELGREIVLDPTFEFPGQSNLSPRQQKYHEEYLNAVAALTRLANALKPKLCRGGAIEFAICDAGSGPNGGALKQIVQQIFGAATIFMGNCYPTDGGTIGIST